MTSVKSRILQFQQNGGGGTENGGTCLKRSELKNSKGTVETSKNGENGCEDLKFFHKEGKRTTSGGSNDQRSGLPVQLNGVGDCNNNNGKVNGHTSPTKLIAHGKLQCSAVTPPASCREPVESDKIAWKKSLDGCGSSSNKLQGKSPGDSKIGMALGDSVGGEKPQAKKKNVTSMSINLSSSNNKEDTRSSGGVKESCKSVNSKSSIGHGGLGATATRPSGLGSLGTARFVKQSSGGKSMASSGLGQRCSASPSSPVSPAGTKAFGSTPRPSTTSRIYDAIGWKEKFEDSERRRNHLAQLAKKATKDYEELRKRYQAAYHEKSSLQLRHDECKRKLEALQKVSGTVYEEYHALRKQLEIEHQAKTEALGRVDHYNKENRRLKRTSALMMQRIDDPSFLNVEQLEQENGNEESDREIGYLRNKVQEFQKRILELEKELENTKLTEFETQESVMLMNDSMSGFKKEVLTLRTKYEKAEEECSKAKAQLETVNQELEEMREKHGIDLEKLHYAEEELKKLTSEKKVLQRQSLVFMNDADLDNRLMEALGQIAELQTTQEEQKNNYETEISELKRHLTEKDCVIEALKLETDAKIHALEAEVETLKKRVEDGAENDISCMMQNSLAAPPPPPPPPPPMCGGLGPLPTTSSPLCSSGSLVDALSTAKLRKASTNSCVSEGSVDEGQQGGGKLLVPADSKFDSMIHQIKQGVKLRPAESRTLPRNIPGRSPPENSNGSPAVEEMKAMLDTFRKNSQNMNWEKRT